MKSSIAQERAYDQDFFDGSMDSRPLRSDLDEEIRARLRVLIEDLLNEELDEVLGVGSYERNRGREGYRNGTRDRTLTCQAGTRTISVPRARWFEAAGTGTREYRSEFMPYYKRRTEAVDQTLLGTYLCGASTRKIKKALKPLWREGPLSKSAVSRLAPRLKARLEEFNHRDLSGRTWGYVYLDAIFLKVRLAGKVVSVPVRAGLGVDETGRKERLALSLWSQESTGAWFWVCQALRDRGLVEVVLCILDGNRGLHEAVTRTWPQADIQRCTVHKERNLLDKTPRHARERVQADYQAIIYAESETWARRAWTTFVKKWRTKLPDVVTSLEEGGEELLTFFRYPKSQWKALRTTNALERLNQEFRRRVKVQGSLPDSPTAVALLAALWEDGCITYRRLDGHADLKAVLKDRGVARTSETELDKVA